MWRCVMSVDVRSCSWIRPSSVQFKSVAQILFHLLRDMMATRRPFAATAEVHRDSREPALHAAQLRNMGHISLRLNIHQPQELYRADSANTAHLSSELVSPLASPDPEAGTGRRRRSTHRGSMIGSSSLKLLNKPIISYRDAMEG